jgi:hypothetical protein
MFLGSIEGRHVVMLICIQLYVLLYMCVSVFTSIYLNICIYLYIFKYTYLCIHIFVYVHRGRWTEEEYEYALALIEAFNAGLYT